MTLSPRLLVPLLLAGLRLGAGGPAARAQSLPPDSAASRRAPLPPTAGTKSLPPDSAATRQRRRLRLLAGGSALGY